MPVSQEAETKSELVVNFVLLFSSIRSIDVAGSTISGPWACCFLNKDGLLLHAAEKLSACLERTRISLLIGEQVSDYSGKQNQPLSRLAQFSF